MSTFKRLFFDIETSPNIMFSWTAGYKLNLPPENILTERAIICICYKWEHSSKVYSLEWKKGDDKQLLLDFMKIMNEADEIVGHNSDNFDIKWIRTRCLNHRIPAIPEYISLDTYKFAKKYFRFNSNKLNYISQFLGFGNKIKTEFSLWKKIVLENDLLAMTKMIKYCKKDVVLLEQVYKTLQPYVKHKTHIGVLKGGLKIDCPECASSHTQSRGTTVSAVGVIKRRCQCMDCKKWFAVANNTFNKELSKRTRKDLI